MSHNRITSVYDSSKITTFVEHTYINSKNVSVVDNSTHSTFVRADNHKMISIKLNVINISKKIFYKLVCWHN